MTPPNVDEDPGWGPVLRTLPTLLIPFIGMRTMASQSSGLHATRLLWLVFVNAIILLWIPVLLLGETDGAPVAAPIGLAVTAIIGIGLYALARVVVPPIDGRSADALARSFQRATLVRIMLAEAAAIVGFVCFLLTGSWLVYGAGFVIAAWGMWLAAPRTATLAATQAGLVGRGSDLHLIRVLNTTRLTR